MKPTDIYRFSPAWRQTAYAAVVLCSALASGCATTGQTATGTPGDPFESWNRGVYKFNDGLDRVALKPAATAYGKVIPEPVRNGIHNFFSNFRDAWSAVNLLLQGRIAAALNDGMRVSVNTVLGIAGTLDIATEMRLDSHKQDMGLTLGHWGMGSGPYLVWPVLGPSTLRDSLGLPLDRAAGPVFLTRHSVPTTNSLLALELIDTRYTLIALTDVLDDVAIDPYAFTRDGYLQRRRNMIEDGLSALPGGDRAAQLKAPVVAQADAATLAGLELAWLQAPAAEPSNASPASWSPSNWAQVAEAEARDTFGSVHGEPKPAGTNTLAANRPAAVAAPSVGRPTTAGLSTWRSDRVVIKAAMAGHSLGVIKHCFAPSSGSPESPDLAAAAP